MLIEVFVYDDTLGHDRVVAWLTNILDYPPFVKAYCGDARWRIIEFTSSAHQKQDKADDHSIDGG